MSESFAAFQRLLPQHGLSRLAGRLAKSESARLSRLLIRTFARHYRVDMGDAAEPSLDGYRSFNDFFTRALREGTRPLDADPAALLCPADGTISQAGRIDGDRLLQAKGTSYSLRALTGEDCREFHGGSFATVYLAPRDYHRVHLPLAGTLRRTRAIPGALFSVNARTEAAISDLFCRNERLVCRFETAAGAMLVVLVGALIVASIETVWDEAPSPYRRSTSRAWEVSFPRGAEIGRFLLGSTVIVCCEPDRVVLEPSLCHGEPVRVGQRLGTVRA
ncbi:MAG: archaetidylserine decarboxylase [Pseudomonadales bacterium]